MAVFSIDCTCKQVYSHKRMKHANAKSQDRIEVQALLPQVGTAQPETVAETLPVMHESLLGQAENAHAKPSELLRLPPVLVSNIFLSPGGGCWNWMRHVDEDGYGRVKSKWKLRSAHRTIYELLIGKIPDGLVLDHLCRNRKYVNPAHLEPVTNFENIMRGVGLAVTNRVKTNCPGGHPYDEATTGQKTRNGKAVGRYCRICQNARVRDRKRLANKLKREQSA